MYTRVAVSLAVNSPLQSRLLNQTPSTIATLPTELSVRPGKIADITGHVWSVNKKGQYWEVEFISGLGANLICKMRGEDTDVASSLKQGESVTVRGKILGVPGFMNGVVEPCEVISK